MKQNLWEKMKQQYRQQCEERQEQVIGMYLNQERWENPADYYLRREWEETQPKGDTANKER